MMPRTQAMQKRRNATKALDSFVNFLLACLPLIGFLLFMLIPMVLGFGMSFMQLYTPVFSDGVFCGFDNYARLLWGEDAAMFYRAFLNTIIFWLNVPISMALGLGISYLLNREIVAKKFFRTVFFIPYVCSIVACTLMFKMMYETNFGIFNTMLSAFGISNIEWITDPDLIVWSSMFMQSWRNIGFCVILFQAALRNDLLPHHVPRGQPDDLLSAHRVYDRCISGHGRSAGHGVGKRDVPGRCLPAGHAVHLRYGILCAPAVRIRDRLGGKLAACDLYPHCDADLFQTLEKVGAL